MTASTLVANIPETTRSRASGQALDWVRVAAAAGLLAGVLLALLGFAWDVQWHIDVGPDTFFTAPHLVFYSGVAVSGLTSLAMVLLNTWYARRGLTAAQEGATAILGGRFIAPLGYVVGGFGALFFLLFGLMDQWWHTLYGFDVTLVSPPHVGLILSIMVSMAGCLMAFAWHVRTAHGQGPRSLLAAAGCVLAAAVLAMFILPTLTDLVPWVIFDRVSWPNLVVSFLFPAIILLVAVIVRRPWAGTLFGLFFTGLDFLLTVILPAITQGYAASIGLFLRDNVRGEAFIPAIAPTYVLAAGIVVDLLLQMGRRFGWRVGITVPLAGAAAALMLQLLEPTLPAYQPSDFYPPEIRQEIAEIAASVATSSLILAPIVGALAGWFGWLLGIVLAGRDAEEPEAPASGAVRPALVATAAALLLTPAAAQAHAVDPHHETIQAGPYSVVVGFSEWPMRAERSLDITFEPAGGIADKSATIRITDAQGEPYELGPLGRHPRQREMWGLDLIALPTPGDWTIELTVDGPEGSGTATLSGIPVGERPGPSPLPFWIVAALPLLFLLALGVRGWRAVRPGRSPEAHAWG
jgi:hypothetical protein